MKIVLLVLLLFLHSLPGNTASTGWLDKNGNLIPNSDSQKWVDGFGGWLIVTSDNDWKEKWNNSKWKTPVFTETKDVELGEKIVVLTLFKNPQVDVQHQVDITCDIRITRPDGTVSYEAIDVECARGKLVGKRENVRLSHAIIEFIGELSDPYGIWIVEVILKDNNGNVVIPLKSSFAFINTATMT